MQELFIQILNSGIIASYIIVAVILIRLIFKKLPKRTLVLLWALVAIKLILPFSFESSLSLVPESNPIPQTIIGTPVPDDNSNTDVQPIIPPTDFENNFAPSVPNNNVVPDNATVSQPNYTLIALFVWLAGVGVLLIYGAVSYALLYRRVLGATPLFDNIRQHEKVQSPFILGFIKPKIYVPYNLDKSTLKNVILHENAHIKYCDHLIKPFAFILLAVYWFNPLVWVSYILLCRDIEFACDERVVVQLPENARSNYAEALVKCGVNRLRISACPVAFGETGIKERVKNIMNYKKPAFWITITAIILTIAITVCFLTVNPKDSADKTTDSSPTPTVSASPSQTPLTPETHMTPDPSPTPIKPKNDMANEELAQVVAKLLRVPDKEGITHGISDKFYWEAAESYYKYVAFYENDELVACACVDPRDGELLRNIFLYSAPTPITPPPTPNEVFARVVAKQLNVPDRDSITYYVSEELYSAIADIYFRRVEFFENGESIASAEVNSRNGNLWRYIYMYTEPTNIPEKYYVLNNNYLFYSTSKLLEYTDSITNEKYFKQFRFNIEFYPNGATLDTPNAKNTETSFARSVFRVVEDNNTVLIPRKNCPECLKPLQQEILDDLSQNANRTVLWDEVFTEKSCYLLYPSINVKGEDYALYTLPKEKEIDAPIYAYTIDRTNGSINYTIEYKANTLSQLTSLKFSDPINNYMDVHFLLNGEQIYWGYVGMPM